MVLATQVTVLAVQDLLWGPALRKYPELKVAFSEGGIGWIPFLLDRADRHYQNQRWTRQDFGAKLPSEVFREHALACFISDPTSLKLYKEIGVDLIAFEVDYPHSDSVWPDAPEFLLAQLEGAGMSDEDIAKVTWRNVARFCQLRPVRRDPQGAGDRRRAAARATDVDTSTSRGASGALGSRPTPRSSSRRPEQPTAEARHHDDHAGERHRPRVRERDLGTRSARRARRRTRAGNSARCSTIVVCSCSVRSSSTTRRSTGSATC